MTDTPVSTDGLGAIPETLLIPLAARVIASSWFPRAGFADSAAEAIAGRLDTDLSRFTKNRGSMHASILRACWFDDVARRFLAMHPDGLCISLGAGLDTRAQRIGLVDHDRATWLDLDLPEVVALRTMLIPDARNIRSLVGDAADPVVWIDAAPWTSGRPLLVLIEGVIMYLPIAQVRGLVQALCAAADDRGAEMWLALDYASPFMARTARSHPSVAKTSASFASFLRRPSDLCDGQKGLDVLDHRDISSAAGAAGFVVGSLHRLLTGGRRIHGCALYRYAAQ